MNLTETALIEFLQEQRQITGVSRDSALFSDGTIDSLGMIDLITFIEATEGVEIGLADVTLENFDTVARIYAFVREKVAA